MPRYLVTNDSFYRPFSYDELAKPLVQMAQAQNAAADTYDALNLETDALDSYISHDEGDANARRMYDTYRGQLATLQDELWRNGFTAKTRRQLAQARAGFAGINSIKEGINLRNKRSEEYWKYRHEHPDAVTGADPATIGLDSYVADPTTGLNYYNYSGDVFMNEVGTDAKARADELLRDIDRRIQTMKSDAPGYLLQIQQNGFSSTEVNRAAEIARGVLNGEVNRSNIDSNSPEGMLAEVLLSHVDSTGARSQVSHEDFDRLVEYGVAGLSQAIGKTSITTLEDKQYAYNQALNLEREKARIKNGSQDGRQGYPLVVNPDYIENAGYKDLADKMKGKQDKLNDVGGTVQLIGSDGKPITNADGTGLSDPMSIGNALYNTEARQYIREITHGLDIAAPIGSGKNRQQGYIELNGSRIPVTLVELNSEEAAQYGSPVAIQTMDGHRINSSVLNQKLAEHQTQMQSFRNNNSVVNIDDYAMTPKEEANLRKAYNIPATVDSADIPDIVRTISRVGYYTPAALVDNQGGTMDKMRELVANSIMDGRTRFGDNIEYDFYPMSNGHRVGSEGKKTYSDVFGKDSITKNDIGTVTLSLEDITRRGADGRNAPTFSFTTPNNSGAVWNTNARMIDPLYEALTTPHYSLGGSVADVARALAMPILEPTRVAQMTEAESDNWGRQMYSLLATDTSPEGKADLRRLEITVDGKKVIPSAKDFLQSQNEQDVLYGIIINFVNREISTVRDAAIQDGFSDDQKAPSYVTYPSFLR